MRSLTGTKNPDGPADPIIEHPDVRRMLLSMKAISEGARSMIYECAMLNDHMYEAEAAGDTKKAKAVDDRMGFLTPILKGFLTELAVDAANMGIQVYGGHGYIKSNKQEQVLRDVRIAAVWEGTTGIQGLDLLGRKVMLQKFGPLHAHLMGPDGLWVFFPLVRAHPSIRYLRFLVDFLFRYPCSRWCSHLGSTTTDGFLFLCTGTLTASHWRRRAVGPGFGLTHSRY